MLRSLRSPAGALLLLAALSLGACDLTVEDPNATTSDDAFGTRSGLLASAVGLQQLYNVSTLDNVVITTGITSREIAVTTTLSNYTDLETGGAGLPDDNPNVGGLFSGLYRVAGFAEDLAAGAETAPDVEPALRSGLIALGQFYRAVAIGTLAQNFEQVALETGPDAAYSARTDAFNTAADLLGEAAAGLTATPPNAAFQDVLPAGFDLLNTVRAYRARYELFAGNYAEAIAAANAVGAGATSTFAYDALSENPLYTFFYVGTTYGTARENLGLPSVEPGDGRVDFYTGDASELASASDLPIVDVEGFATGQAVSIPAYLPDELALIRAEANVRLGNLAAAVADIDRVRTDTDDPFGVNAALAPYSGPVTEAALLAEIFYNRATELYLQGLRLEDARRLGQPGPTSGNAFQRTRNFYPYPQTEEQANPNTPADPAI